MTVAERLPVFYQNFKNLDHPVKPDDDNVWDCRAPLRGSQ
jgi:hypothetical protein